MIARAADVAGCRARRPRSTAGASRRRWARRSSCATGPLELPAGRAPLDEPGVPPRRGRDHRPLRRRGAPAAAARPTWRRWRGRCRRTCACSTVPRGGRPGPGAAAGARPLQAAVAAAAGPGPRRPAQAEAALAAARRRAAGGRRRCSRRPSGPRSARALAALQRVDVTETVPRPSWNRRPVDRSPLPAAARPSARGPGPGRGRAVRRPSSRPRSRRTGPGAPAEALRPFDALEAKGDGWLLPPEARLNRALCLARAGQRDAARRMLLRTGDSRFEDAIDRLLEAVGSAQALSPRSRLAPRSARARIKSGLFTEVLMAEHGPRGDRDETRRDRDRVLQRQGARAT